MIFLEVTQEQMYGNMGLEMMDPIALDYTQWFLASMSLGPRPRPSTTQPKFISYLHSEESNAGQQIHCGL